MSPLIRFGGGSQLVFSQNCSVFNTKALAFAACPPMPTGRSLLGVAAAGNYVFAIGGYAMPGEVTPSCHAVVCV